MSRPLQVMSAVMTPAGRVPGVKAGLGALTSRFVKGSTGGPSAEERAQGRSHIVAMAFDAGGRCLSEVRVEGANGYDFTAGMLAWGAMRVVERGFAGQGALGPVEALGLDELEAGAAEAGIARI